jgi:hypothetical protein
VEDIIQPRSAGSDEPNKLAYEACTKSGAVIMLLTVGLGLLVPYWRGRPAELAAGRYTVLRESLWIYTNAVHNDPLWQEYLGQEPAAESMSIADLLALAFPGPTHKAKDDLLPKPPLRKTRSNKIPPPTVMTPSAPTGLTSTTYSSLNGIQELADALAEVGGSDLLTQSRKESNYYNFSIMEWITERDTRMYRNQVTEKCPTPGPFPPLASSDPFFVRGLDRDNVLKCLTLNDVDALAEFNRPVFSNPAQVSGRIQKEVDLNPSTLPRDLATATVLAEALLFFMITYFAGFVREVVHSDTFPATGSLFKAFSSSRWSLLILFLSVWLPFIATVILAYVARSWLFALCGALVLFAVSSVFLELWKVSYFSPVSPGLLIEQLRRAYASNDKSASA